MTRLTDAELEELELVAASNAGKRTLRCVCDTLPAILAELRALRKVREAAESLREANEAIYKTEYAFRLEAELKEIRTKLDLFAALDEARGEQ